MKRDLLILAACTVISGGTGNQYYDDMEWNAIATLRVYEATGDGRFCLTYNQGTFIGAAVSAAHGR